MISKRDVEGRIIASLLYGTKGLQGRIIRECEPCHFSLYKDKFEDAKKILVEYGCFTGPQQEILANGIQFRDGLDISDAIVNLKDMYIRESLKILSTQLVMAADSVEVELDQLHERFLELTSNYNPIIRMKSIRDVVPEVLSKTKELQNFPEVQWGYNRFSIMSLEPGTMVALCARPRVGKTAFGLNLAIRMAEAGDPVGFICIEMPNDQIATRIMCIKSHCRYQEIKDREFTDKDVALNFNSNIEKVKNLPIYLSCGIKYDMARIEKLVTHWVKKYGIRCVFIDYLQKLTHRKAESERIRVGNTSHDVKELGLKLGIPTILMSQLNRNAEGTKPTLKDIKETGDVEQDADIVILMDRFVGDPEDDKAGNRKYYTRIDGLRSEIDLNHNTVFIVAKNRNGTCRNIALKHYMEHFKFFE